MKIAVTILTLSINIGMVFAHEESMTKGQMTLSHVVHYGLFGGAIVASTIAIYRNRKEIFKKK